MRLPALQPLSKRRWLELTVAAALFVYLVWIRTHNISQQFWLFGDQIRDWRIAMGPLLDLPLVGAPSSAGGTMLGPVYYWVLWGIRVVLGPWYEHLPHAGGIGLSIIHSAADALLMLALASRLQSIPLATAAVLFAATSPYDMALTATIWNPPLAVALGKVTMAVVLFQREWSLARTVVIVAVAWLSVQSHVGAIFTATAAAGWNVFQPFAKRNYRAGLSALRAAAEVVLLLQVPYVIAHWNRPTTTESFAPAESIGYVLQNPGSLRLGGSARALASVMDYLLFAPWFVAWSGLLLLLAGVLATWLWRRQGTVLATSVGPLVLAILGFTVWRGRLGEHYWYLPVIACAAITLVLPIAAWPSRSRAAAVIHTLVLLAVIAAQPARCQASWRIHRMPEYAAMVRGARQVKHQAPRARQISAPFAPPGTSVEFLYELLGGQISRESTVVAMIDAEGHVSYARAQ